MDVMTEVESEVIDVDNIEGQKQSCLVGRLVTEKHWNLSTLIEALTKAWQPKHGMSSRELGQSKLILFCFDDAMDRDLVLKNQPWLFKGYLFAIKTFSRRNEQQPLSSVNVTIEHAAFWVRLYDVPFSCMNERSMRLFAKQIGILETVDKSDEDLVGTFMRFKVSVNITKPLLRGITVRVKRKHVWLQLKYESLPIYCFSCGTIGHVHKNCQSYNRTLKFSTCKLRASSEKTKKDAPNSLPHDIVEIILLQLPVKALLRFKAVSKQWKATISDPRFVDTHFQLYKSSSSRNLLAWYDSYNISYSGFHVAELLKNQFKFKSKIKHPRNNHMPHGCELKCNCDGLYLIRLPITLGKTYVLCNPSCRAEKEIRCPQKIDDFSDYAKTLYGIYYNPLMMDYKVVIADRMRLVAVFSCRYNKWSEVKHMGNVISSISSISCRSGVSFNGSLYWLENVRHLRHQFEIICFDGKDEKFKKLAGPDHCRADDFYLTSSRGHLCLFYSNSDNEMVIMKTAKVDEKESWMEFKVQLQPSPRCQYVKMPRPICWVGEDELIIGDANVDGKYYMICDLSKSTVVVRKNPFRLRTSHPFPYLQNLFWQ